MNLITRGLLNRAILFRNCGVRVIHIDSVKRDKPIFDDIVTKNRISEASRSEIEADVAKQTKDWVSFGFDRTDRKFDTFTWNWIMFWTVSVAMVGFTFLVIYAPDPGLRDWARREGYLELERRTKLGLPLVDRNLVPPERVTLPDESALGREYKPIL